MAPDSMMCNVAFAERGFNNSAREVFDLGIERLKSGQSAALLFIEFVAKNLWIQFLGRCARMAQELPEINAAVKSSNWWERAETASNCLVRCACGYSKPFWNSAHGLRVFTNDS